MVRIVPPFSTNFFSSGTVFATVTRPSHGRNSAGIESAAGWPPPKAPPAFPPACPEPADGSRAGMPPSTNTSTSYFAFRLPASSICGKTTSNGNSYCSKIQRVQPDGIEPPY